MFVVLAPLAFNTRSPFVCTAQQGRGSGKLDVTFVSGTVQLISDIKWIIVDSKVYDIGRFKDLHPGGASVLLDEEIGEST